jgi:hypothetical protein
MSFTDLPVELIHQIMCACEDIVCLVNVAATCRKTHAILRDNTKSIIGEVLAISQTDCQATLDLAEIEASIAELADDDICSRLYYVDRSVTIVTALREEMGVGHVDTGDVWTSSDDQCQYKYTVTTSMFWQCYIKFRRIAIGFQYPGYLPAAYKLLHDSSGYDLELLCLVMDLLDQNWDCNSWEDYEDDTTEEWETFAGSERDNIRSWPIMFARAVFNTEREWCIDGASDDRCRVGFRYLRRHLNQKTFALMFGDNKTPWTKWPREPFWPVKR